MGRQGTAIGWFLSCLALLLVTGCGRTVTRLDPADEATWTTLNDRAERYPTRIRLRDEEARDVSGARFAPDTTRWAELAPGEVYADGGLVAFIVLTPVATAAVGGAVGAILGGDESFFVGDPPPPDLRYLPGSGAPAPDYVKKRRGK